MFHREMAFAGTWYPAGREACERLVREYGADAAPAEGARCGVVPHAGWVFSGALAARVFGTLVPAPEVELVIVVGGHLGGRDPVVAMSEGRWETPFGPFRIHTGFREELEALPRVVLESERRAYPDNSTELQLPFAKYRYPEAELLVLRAPPSSDALVLGQRLAAYLERTGIRAVAVASTDLTHYGDNYGFAPHGRGAGALRWVREENDPAFIEAVASGEGERILAVSRERHNACSAGAVAAVNEVARARGLRFEPLDYATSADVMPRDLSSFVGYLAGVYR